MNTTYIEKKLREARFFLDKMSEHERMASENTEPFDFYLSAFLNAGMSVRNGFHMGQNRSLNAAIKFWRSRWELNLTHSEKSVYAFMHADRVAEVHWAGSSRIVKTLASDFGGIAVDLHDV